MALILRKSLLEALAPLHQFKRFRGKIDVRRPRPPHFEKALFLKLAEPWYLSNKKGKTPAELCRGFKEEFELKRDEIDNPLQRIIAREIYERFVESRLVLFFHLNPMKADLMQRATISCAKKDMFLKQYGKRTMQMAVQGTPYEAVLDIYVSHNMTLFSPKPDVKSVLKITKRYPKMVLIAGIFEGRLLDKDDLLKYSEIPDIQTAQSVLVQTLNTLGGQLVNHLNRHQTDLTSNLQERIKQLEEDKR